MVPVCTANGLGYYRLGGYLHVGTCSYISAGVEVYFGLGKCGVAVSTGLSRDHILFQVGIASWKSFRSRVAYMVRVFCKSWC